MGDSYDDVLAYLGGIAAEGDLLNAEYWHDDPIDAPRIEKLARSLAEENAPGCAGEPLDSEWYVNHTEALARALGRDPDEDELCVAQRAYSDHVETMWAQRNTDDDEPEEDDDFAEDGSSGGEAPDSGE